MNYPSNSYISHNATFYSTSLCSAPLKAQKPRYWDRFQRKRHISSQPLVQSQASPPTLPFERPCIPCAFIICASTDLGAPQSSASSRCVCCASLPLYWPLSNSNARELLAIKRNWVNTNRFAFKSLQMTPNPRHPGRRKLQRGAKWSPWSGNMFLSKNNTPLKKPIPGHLIMTFTH